MQFNRFIWSLYANAAEGRRDIIGKRAIEALLGRKKHSRAVSARRPA